MRAELSPSRKRAHGFSLIEIVVVLAIIGLIAGASASVALRTTRGNLQERTLQRMQEIFTAMVGAPERGHYGYIGDMGELPDTALTQLFQLGAQTPALADPVDGIVSGYAGPYVLKGTHATLGFVDFWSSQIRYTPGNAQLTSLGPDRTLGTADDIVYPSAAPVVQGTITVVVRGILGDGGPPLNLRSDEASVAIFHTRASDNTRSAAAVSYTGAQGSGVWRSDVALHRGPHAVVITGLDATASGGRNFAGSVARAIVFVTRGPAFAELALEEAP